MHIGRNVEELRFVKGGVVELDDFEFFFIHFRECIQESLKILSFASGAVPGENVLRSQQKKHRRGTWCRNGVEKDTGA